jgi:hypothetical protein
MVATPLQNFYGGLTQHPDLREVITAAALNRRQTSRENGTKRSDINVHKGEGTRELLDVVSSVKFAWKSTWRITSRASIPVDIGSVGNVSGDTSHSN